MKKKGFTLIELLAVIIILAVIALIATPVVLNVIDNARRQANKDSAYGILDSAKLYYADSLLDESNNINETVNVIDKISIYGDKPDSGVVYITSKGEIALGVVYDKICYTKKYNENDLAESDDIENCGLDIDTTAPSVSISDITVEPDTASVTAMCSDVESGITKYEFSSDGVTWIDNGTNSSYTFEGLNPGTEYTFSVRCTNGSGMMKTVSENKSTLVIIYKCKRATTLHTEECAQTSNTYNCGAAGYKTSGSKKTTTITYGNLGTRGTLSSGDAFDCDVNGDEIYDSATERFYYVTDFTLDNKEYAVLLYYNNTTAGVADNSSSSAIAYHSNRKNYYGPVTAIVNLPTTSQWTNISLSSTSRAITNHNGGPKTSGGTLPTAFSYTKTVDGEVVPLAARLLTYQEVVTACSGDVSTSNNGGLDGCNYLMENTMYSNSSLGTAGYWLENPKESSNYYTSVVETSFRSLYTSADSQSSYQYGTRPVIEVLKTEIQYK